MENKPSISIGTLILGLLITSIIFLTYYFFPDLKNNYERLVASKTQSVETPTDTPPTPTPTRNPNYKLPEGPQSYNFSHGYAVTGPRVTTVSFTPLAVEKDASQAVSAVFPASENVTSAIFSFTTDNLTDQKLDLKQKPGNPSIWEGGWIMPDTTKNRYHVRLIFTGAKGTYDEVMKILE